jgi:hypothetical protein
MHGFSSFFFLYPRGFEQALEYFFSKEKNDEW